MATDQSRRIHLLGPPTCLVGQEYRPLIRKGGAVVAFAAMKSGTEVARRDLAHLLWPRSGTASARHSLSQALYTLRRAGLNELLVITPTCVRLSNSVELDVAEFEEAIAQTDWGRASDLYGTFMESFELGESGFEGWLATNRLRFAKLASHALERLTCELDWNRTANLAERLLVLDPLDAEARRALIRALVSSGKKQRADAELQEAKRAWAEELGGEFELGFSLDELQAEFGPFAASSDQHAAPFVGREKELQRMERAWVRCGHHGLQILTLLGEPGVGKTMLTRRFQRLVAIRGGTSAWATGFELERKIPLGVMGQLLGDLQLHNVPVPARCFVAIKSFFSSFGPKTSKPVSPSLPETGRYVLFDAIAQLLSSVSSHRPLVLFVDDAHWADDVSRGCLHYLARRLSGCNVFIVYSARLDFAVVRGPLWPRSELLRISPWTVAEVAAVAEWFGSKTKRGQDEYAVQLHNRTGGNPLLVTALLSDGAEPDNQGDGIPTSVNEYLGPRLAGLGPEGRLLVAAMGVLPTGLSFETIARVAGVEWEAAQRALEELVTEGALTEEGAALQLRHGLLGEVAVAQLNPVTERLIRGRAARVLAEAGVSKPGALAVQFDLAGQRADAFVNAVRAAEASAALFAHEEAEFFYNIALANAADVESGLRIRIALADLLLRLGRHVEADQCLNEAEPAPRSGPSAPLARKLLVYKRLVDLTIRPHPAVVTDSWQLFHALANQVEPDLTVRLLTKIASAAHDMGRGDDVMRAVRTTIEWLPRIHDTRSRIGSELAAVQALAYHESHQDALGRLAALAGNIDGWPDLNIALLSSRGAVLTAAGKLLDAEENLLLAVELIERFGVYDYEFAALNNLGVCYQEQGRYEEALELFERTLSSHGRLVAVNKTAVALDNMVVVLYEMGEHKRALDACLRFEQLATANGSTRPSLVRLAIRGLSSLALGRVAEAQACKRDIDDGFPNTSRLSNDVSQSELFVARMERRGGNQHVAITRLARLAERYWNRDVFCAARMEIERLTMLLVSDPGEVLTTVNALSARLGDSGGRPVLDALDSLAVRARRRLESA